MTGLSTGGGTAPDFTAMTVKDLLDHAAVVGEPRRGPRRFWTCAELRILRQHYSKLGVAGCLPLLPGRSAGAIYVKAGELELDRPPTPREPRPRGFTTTPEIDAAIRKLYAGRPRRGEVATFARGVERPSTWVQRRALALGCEMPRFRQPPWSEPENDILADAPAISLLALRRRLKAAGYNRSERAIEVQLHRLGLSRVDTEQLTASSLAELLGVNPTTVLRWISTGKLAAKRRSSSDQASFEISRRAVKAFVAAHPTAFPLGGVNQLWFIGVLVRP